MKWLTLVLISIMLPNAVFAAVGSITEQSGSTAQIERNKNKLTASKGTGVEMNDAVTTAKTKLGITFQDNTRVQVNEQSRLVIDDFVYDPKNSDAGKLGMKVALGTVRYASGQIAKNNPQKVAISTPTATIAVRGTDFTMTVDEVGKSLIILLPSCPPNFKREDECITGVIEVSTDVGSVILNQAFQATVVNSASQAPSDPKLIDINENSINNNLIISPPSEVANDMRSVQQDTTDDNGLSKDFLEYRELTKNQLEDDLLKEVNMNTAALDRDYLDNMLDINTAAMLGSELEADDPVLPNIKQFPWIPKAYNEEQIFIYSDRSPHVASITVTRDTNGVANITQDGVGGGIIFNGGGTNVVFNIAQTQ
jgi:hypothetical protein